MSMIPIATSGVLAANSSPVLFSNIPQTFTHLQFRVFGRSYNDGANYSSLYLNPNNDGNGANYKAHYLLGNGSSAASGAVGNVIYSCLSGQTSTASVFGLAIVDVLDYTNTNKYKTIRGIGGYDQNGVGTVTLGSVLWMQTTAVSSFALGPDGTWEAGTRIDLYGITTSSATGA